MPAMLAFRQAISGAGFTWKEASPHQQPRIRLPWNSDATPRLLLFQEEDGQGSRVVTPTKGDSGLFSNFASMEPTPEQIIEFSNRYGGLWMTDGEPFAEWEYEIRTMRFLIEVWYAIEARKRSGVISEHFRPDASGLIKYPFPEIFEYDPYAWKRTRATVHGASPGVVWDLTPFGAKRSAFEAAALFLADAINARLDALGVRIALGKSPTQLTFQPHDLIGALWLQFAIAVAENKEFRKCSTCGRAFELEPDINRISRFYCDDACRVKAYRQRKAEAKRLYKRGKTLEQIAVKLESDVSTIKGWVQPKGK